MSDLNSDERARLQALETENAQLREKLQAYEENQARLERNSKLHVKWFHEMNVERNHDYANTALSDDFRSWFYPEGVRGREPAVEGIKAMGVGLSDPEFIIDEVFSADDFSCCVARYRGTHTGNLLGVPATGKRIELRIVDVNRYNEDGSICEAFPMPDLYGLMEQLGVHSGMGHVVPGESE